MKKGKARSLSKSASRKVFKKAAAGTKARNKVKNMMGVRGGLMIN